MQIIFKKHKLIYQRPPAEGPLPNGSAENVEESISKARSLIEKAENRAPGFENENFRRRLRMSVEVSKIAIELRQKEAIDNNIANLISQLQEAEKIEAEDKNFAKYEGAHNRVKQVIRDVRKRNNESPNEIRTAALSKADKLWEDMSKLERGDVEGHLNRLNKIWDIMALNIGLNDMAIANDLARRVRNVMTEIAVWNEPGEDISDEQRKEQLARLYTEAEQLRLEIDKNIKANGEPSHFYGQGVDQSHSLYVEMTIELNRVIKKPDLARDLIKKNRFMTRKMTYLEKLNKMRIEYSSVGEFHDEIWRAIDELAVIHDEEKLDAFSQTIMGDLQRKYINSPEQYTSF